MTDFSHEIILQDVPVKTVITSGSEFLTLGGVFLGVKKLMGFEKFMATSKGGQQSPVFWMSW